MRNSPKATILTNSPAEFFRRYPHSSAEFWRHRNKVVSGRLRPFESLFSELAEAEMGQFFRIDELLQGHVSSHGPDAQHPARQP